MEKKILRQNTLGFRSALECACLKDAKQCKIKILVKHEQLKTSPFFCHLCLIHLLKTNSLSNKENSLLVF